MAIESQTLHLDDIGQIIPGLTTISFDATSVSKTFREKLNVYKPSVSIDEYIRRTDAVLKLNKYPSVAQIKDLWKGKKAIIIGGGTSLKDTFQDIRLQKQAHPKDVFTFALNRSHDWMLEGERRGRKNWNRYPLRPDFGVMIDGNIYVANYQTPTPGVVYLLGTTLHPAVWAKFALHDNARIFHWQPLYDGSEVEPLIETYNRKRNIPLSIIAGGSTVGLRAIILAINLGFTEIELHGYDSCFRPGYDPRDKPVNSDLYAYPKPNTIMEMQDFTCTAPDGASKLRVISNSMMTKQALEFTQLISEPRARIIDGVERDVQITFAGDGLLPWMAWKSGIPWVRHARPYEMERKYGNAAYYDYVHTRKGMQNAA